MNSEKIPNNIEPPLVEKENSALAETVPAEALAETIPAENIETRSYDELIDSPGAQAAIRRCLKQIEILKKYRAQQKKGETPAGRKSKPIPRKSNTKLAGIVAGSALALVAIISNEVDNISGPISPADACSAAPSTVQSQVASDIPSQPVSSATSTESSTDVPKTTNNTPSPSATASAAPKTTKSPVKRVPITIPPAAKASPSVPVTANLSAQPPATLPKATHSWGF